MKRLVFFSGGSALSATARELAARRIPATYLITIFDSGGSTQALRRAFAMPAVGDLRNRLLAAADVHAVSGQTLRLLNHRTGCGQRQPAALSELSAFLEHQDWTAITCADEIRHDLASFLEAMPEDFDARNASIGNLALAGAYLRFGRNLEAALERYSRILRITGEIIPVARESLHLGARLENGGVIVGQHIINKQLHCPVRQIFLTPATPWGGEKFEIARPELTERASAAIENADILCFSMGSFYSSILVNLLAKGAGRAIAASRALKIFIPNTGFDPELKGMDIAAQAAIINSTLCGDLAGQASGKMLDAVLIDSANGDYPGGLNEAVISGVTGLGAAMLDGPVVAGPGRHDPSALIKILEGLG